MTPQKHTNQLRSTEISGRVGHDMSVRKTPKIVFLIRMTKRDAKTNWKLTVHNLRKSFVRIWFLLPLSIVIILIISIIIVTGPDNPHFLFNPRRLSI